MSWLSRLTRPVLNKTPNFWSTSNSFHSFSLLPRRTQGPSTPSCPGFFSDGSSSTLPRVIIPSQNSLPLALKNTWFCSTFPGPCLLNDNDIKIIHINNSVQFSSVAQSCPTLCDPMDCSTPGLPVHHQLPELTQTHVHRVGDAIQPSHPLSSPSPPALNLS